jgi:hypothetical protein
MRIVALGTAILIGLWLLDRLLIWCELRGWITYRLTPRPEHSFRKAAGHAMLNLDVFYHPNARHVVELHQEAAIHREEDDEGGPDEGGSCRLGGAGAGSPEP